VFCVLIRVLFCLFSGEDNVTSLMAILRYLRPSTLRKCMNTCRGEVSCVTATFSLVFISFILISVFNVTKSPTILTVLDDLPIDVYELQKDTLSTILLEQENGEVYIAFRLNESAKLLRKIYNVRDAFKPTPVTQAASTSSQNNLSVTIRPTEQAVKDEEKKQKSVSNNGGVTGKGGNSVYPIPSFQKRYLINSRNICVKQKTVSFIVLVHTATQHFQRRSSIRETWANSMLFNNHSMKIVFLLGKSERDSTQILIEHEQKMYKDLVQGDFLDSYHNLTHKGVLGLRWVSEFCPQAKYIVKIDDDVFVNVYKLIEQMDNEMHNKTRHMWCPIRPKGTSPITREGKWKVDKSEFYNMTHYDVVYCNGYFVILTGDIITELFEASKTTRFFWIDDVYLFGLLPDKIGDVKHERLPNLNLNENKAIECFQATDKPCDMLVANAHSDGVMDKLWFGVLKQYKLLAKKYSKESLFMKTG